ncbi:calcium/proton exchanger [Tanacetum coccineum]
MSYDNLRELVRKLVHAPVNSLYYYKVGKTLKQGLCSLKNDADVQGFLKVGYESKWVVDLYVELYGYDAMDFKILDAKDYESPNSSDAYCSSDDEEVGKVKTRSCKLGEGTSKDGEGSSRNSDVSPKWTKSKIASSRKSSQPQCGFRLWASWMGSENSFQIKSLKAEHKCAINYNLGSLVTYKWIAHHFAKEIIEDLFIPLLKIKAAIKEKFLINVSLGQCKRAKRRALYIFEGGLIEHYGRLWEYRQAILDTNPGSTCIVDEEETEYGNTYFRRFYICFKGVKYGWKAGCRRVIGLDGCFLKHTCKGLQRRVAHSYWEKTLNWAMNWFCTVVPSGFQELDVRKGEESFRVNLHLKKCMCKLWELSGIPCIHSVAADSLDSSDSIYIKY